MRYHAHLEYGSSPGHIFYNYEEQKIIEELVLPFINGHVIVLKIGGVNKVFNMKNATFLRLYRTDAAVAATADKSVPQLIQSAEFQKNECTPLLLDKVKQDKSSQPTTSLLQKASQSPKDQVFVIMKFGDAVLDSAYRAVYRSVVRRFGLMCVRVDEIPNSGKISDQILECIAESKYIIADLSGARPNCYYEAGFAHALGKELILCIQDGENAHFDLQGHRFIQWKTESDLRKKLGQRIKALEEGKAKAGDAA